MPERSQYIRLLTKTTALAATLILVCPIVVPAQTPDVSPSLRVGSTTSPIRLDGVLEEESWNNADTIDGLTMIEPVQGGTPSGRTIVRVLATREALYIGVICDDVDPKGIVSFTKQRDGNLRSEDNVRVVLDTFLDGRSGYVFQVNPAGARYDALINAGGDNENSNWDGVWNAATRRSERGWSVEFWIPIQTLSFDPDTTSWHLNIERRIQRLQETDRWASPRRDWKLTQTSRAGLLTGLPQLTQGLGLTLRPGITFGGGIPSPGAKLDGTRDPSLDVYQSVGSNLVSALSINTDFAESDVDTRRTNLTRFPLFFPETRTFFTEGSDIFQFGLGLGTDVVPFFSRRIGLVSGQKIPILAAAKINGRAGMNNVGAIIVRTKQFAGVTPANTMAVARLRRNVLRESSVGVIATVGDPLGRTGSWTVGPDVTFQTSHFRGGKNLRAGAWGLLMNRDGAKRDRSSAGFRVEYPNDLWNISAHAYRIGEGFDPSLGFVTRTGIYNYRFAMTNTPKPETGFLRSMEHEVQNGVITNLKGQWESYRVMIVPLNWRFASGDRIEINAVPTGENLSAIFKIANGVNIPAGPYHWRRYRLEGGTAAKRKYSGQLTWWFGGFYSGHLDQISFTGSLHPSALFTLEISAEHDVANLKEGDFTTTVVGTRGRVNVSPDLQVSSYVQYDTDTRLLGTNSRLRWTFRPLGDLFVIYNHNIKNLQDRWQLDSNQLLVKLQYAFRY